MAQAFYKCEYCGNLNTGRARRYCNRKCRDAAYYQRKKLKAKELFTGIDFLHQAPKRSGRITEA